MQIDGIGVGEALATQPQDTGVPAQQLGRDSFMRLLVNQMRNQNPLEPQTGSDFVAQLAGFSQLEQIESLNDNLVGLAVLQQSNALMAQLTESSALIGQSIRFADPQSGATVEGTVQSVKIQDGLAVLNVDQRDVPLGNVLEVLGAPSQGADDAGDGAAATEA